MTLRHYAAQVTPSASFVILLLRSSRGNGQYTEREVTFLNQINVATFINNLLLCILCCAETEKRRVTSASAHTANGSLTFECLQPQKKKRKRKRFEVTNLRHAETLSIAELFFLYISPSPTMLSFWSCTLNKKKRNSNRVVVISFLSLSLTFFSSLAISQLIGRMPCLLSSQLYTHQGSSPISSPYKGREQEEL